MRKLVTITARFMCLQDLFLELGGGWYASSQICMYQRLVSCVSWTCFLGWREGGRPAVKITCTISGRLVLGGSNAKNWDHNQKEKIFRNNSIEKLCPFKEKHKSLLKLHIIFLRGGEGRRVSVWEGGIGLSPKI